MTAKKIIRLSSNPKGFGTNRDELDIESFDSELPIQNTQSYFENADIGLFVGLWDTTVMIEKPGAYDCDELMFLLEGEVEIKNNRTGKIEKIIAGEAFVIPKGYDCQWIQKGYCRKFYMISENPTEEIPANPSVEGIVILRKNETVEQGNNIAYQNHNNKFNAGTWSTQSFETDFSAYSKNEIVQIVKGKLTLIDINDERHTFEKGEVFFIPQGAIAKWQSSDYLEVFYGSLKS